VAVTAGVMNSVFASLVPAVAAFDLLSGFMVVVYWRSS
jgi:hypothetical protein